MKKLFTLIALAFCIHSYAQQDTAHVEQYCELIATDVSRSKKVTIDINYGEERKKHKDYRLTDENGKLIRFNSVVDAINFLGNQEWKLVSVFPVSFDAKFGSLEYHYIFKKDVAKDDLQAF